MSEFKIMAVTGNPVLHSRSPQLFNSLLSKNQQGIYTRLAADSAAESIFLFKAIGLQGMNVTAPFKSEIIPLLDTVEESAVRVGGVNCVASQDGFLHGINSDLNGVADSLAKAGIDLADQEVVVLGAGGAARAAVCALIACQAKVVIVNRTTSKAEKLALEFNCSYARLDELPELLQKNFIVISTLAAEHNLVQAEWLRAGMIIFDADYKQAVLSKMALTKGCKIIRGEEWLLNQALPAYRLFCKTEPQELQMRESLTNSRPLNLHRIALIGFMGSGKSSSGLLLAQKLGWEFIDSDLIIAERAGKSIARIFAEDGERKFRLMERELLSELAQREKIVLATGGGMVISQENRDCMKKNFLPVWLFALATTIFERTKESDRPLLNCAEPFAQIEHLMEERKNWYAICSELIVSTEAKSVETIAEKIYAEISRLL